MSLRHRSEGGGLSRKEEDYYEKKKLHRGSLKVRRSTGADEMDPRVEKAQQKSSSKPRDASSSWGAVRKAASGGHLSEKPRSQEETSWDMLHRATMSGEIFDAGDHQRVQRKGSKKQGPSTETLRELYKSGSTTVEEAMLLYENLRLSDTQPSEVRTRYSLWAPNYDKDMMRLNYNGHRWTAGELASYMSDEKSGEVLDVAAGTGLLGMALHRFGFKNIDGIDMNVKMLEQAKKKGIYRRIIQAALGSEILPIHENSYDGVMMSSGLWPGHILPFTLPDLLKVVKPGGLIVIGVCEEKEFREIHIEMEKKKIWDRLMKKVVPDFCNGEPGEIWAFTPC